MSEPNGNGARFDLASLAAKAQPTKIRTATARAGADNPFLDAVRSSHEQDRNERDSGWREVEVPSNVLDGVHLRIEFLPDGASDWIEVGPGRFDEIPRDGRDVVFKFTGRDRMKRGRRRQTSAQQPAAGQASEPADVDREDEDSELQPA
jgi:hypothetical protein